MKIINTWMAMCCFRSPSFTFSVELTLKNSDYKFFSIFEAKLAITQLILCIAAKCAIGGNSLGKTS